jgi:5,10-methylenetetrahydromethanopterin reductase
LVRFGIQFASEEVDIRELRRLAGELEGYGFDIIWTGDSYFSRNPYVNLSLMAQGTKAITLGLGCTNPYTRHPVFTSTAVGTINELCGNRLVLAIGAGSRDMLAAVNFHWDDPVRRVRETIEIVKSLMRGETLSYEGKFYDTKKITLPKSFQNKDMPVYVACRRKKMITMAGEVADGVILDAAPLEYVSYALERLKKGAKIGGRSLKDFRFCNLIPFAISKDRELSRNAVRPFVCIDLVSVSNKILELTGIKRKDVDYVMETWPDWDASSKRVTEEMIDKLSITGTKTECIEHIKKYVDLGVNEFLFCTPAGPTIKETLEITSREIIPRFRS